MERTVFLRAIDIEDSGARARYLDSICVDEEFREAVDALLHAHFHPARLLDYPIGADQTRPTFWNQPADSTVDHIGTSIGPYQLREQIGEGGFGLVFVAEQEVPIRRKVALKVIKPWAGSKEVIARFEAERQAVAMMNHPHIAKVACSPKSDPAVMKVYRPRRPKETFDD
ncbi:MAG: serine/threonine protein kinase, partial [Planctomycetota bacterium]